MRKLAAVAAFGLLLSLPAIPAQAGHATWYTIAQWDMNEKPAQTVLRDATGNGFTGTIGGRVTPTKQRYHHFPREPKQAYVPAHVDVVPDDDHLDPSFSDFAVQVSFRWSVQRHDMNLVQKGQGSPTGGLFKMKTSVNPAGSPEPVGGIKCLFRGSNGDSQVMSWGERGGGINPGRLNDGTWHEVQCERNVNGTTMWVDGVFTDINTNQPGEISNDWPIAIGGNTYCRKAGLQCNYWAGDISRVWWMDS